MIFELWESESGHTFFERPLDEAAYQERLIRLGVHEETKHLVWTIQASSYNETMQALYDRNGWGRYRPIEED